MKITKSKKASDLFVHCLEELNVEYVFTVPGEETIDIMNSIRQSEQIRLVVARHEQGAGFMAANYGRLTGRVGVCIVTLGPGATNAMTALAYAHLGGMPMLLVTGQKGIKRREQGFFQLIDTVAMMKPITKMSQQIKSSNEIPTLLQRTFRKAMKARSGAVHLDFPEDIAEETTSSLAPLPLPYCTPRLISDAALSFVLPKIQKASHPLLILGPCCKQGNIHIALDKLIHDKKLYFITTQMGKGAVNEHSPFYLGTAAISDGDDLHTMMEKSDLIITIGYDHVEKPAFLMTKINCDVLHIHNHKPKPHPTYYPQILAIGDISHTLEYLNKHLTLRSCPLFQKAQQAKEQARSTAIDQPSAQPINPHSLVAILQQVMPKKGTLSLDNGLYKLFLARNFVATDCLSVLLDNCLATMGAGLSTAITAKMLYPHRKVVAILGDGGFMMNSQELEAAAKLNRHLVILILQDNAYGMIGWKQKKMRVPTFGVSFSNPNFSDYAKAHGCYSYEVSSNQSLRKCLSDCLRQDKGTHLITVHFSYENANLTGNEQ